MDRDAYGMRTHGSRIKAESRSGILCLAVQTLESRWLVSDEPVSPPSAPSSTRPRTWTERRATIPSRQVPIHRVDWAFDWLVYGLKRSAIVEFFRILAAFTLPVAMLSYVLGGGDRERDYLFRAWGVIGNARAERANGARDEALQDLVRHRFSLAGIDLAGKMLEGLDLRGADLRKAHLDSAQLFGAHLGCRREMSRGWRQRCTDLRGAWLSKANLRGVDLHEVTLDGAHLDSVSIEGGQLPKGLAGLDMNGIRLGAMDLRAADLHDASLNGATLDSAHLDGANLTNAGFMRASLRGATLTHTTLTNARFSEAHLEDARLDGATSVNTAAVGAWLTGASLTGTTWKNPQFARARFDHAKLQDVVIEGGSLAGATFREAQLQRAHFKAVDANGANFTSANFTLATLEPSNFSKANFTFAVLRQVDLSNLGFYGANFQGADLQDATLPAGDVFMDVNLCGADLRRADFRHSSNGSLSWRRVRSLVHANLHGARGAAPEFLRWAIDSMRAIAVDTGTSWRLRDQTPLEIHTMKRPADTWIGACGETSEP